MVVQNKDISPVFYKNLKREDKENLLKQKSKVVWLTGLSGAGKTTIATHLDEELYKRGYIGQILDGDNIRSGINNNLSFSEQDRYENIRRIAEISKLFMNCGIIIINSFISPTDKIRKMAMDIIGKENFIEIFVNAPIEVCEERDVKGLYAKARKGEIINFTGIDSPFEIPENCDIELNTDRQTVEESVSLALEHIVPLVEYKE
ncbi:MAG: adenylyl-sulfate kinase [Bacteroidales bacterium]|nr:adenylyl-sulfate kinase [Bacteroidales bacterium]